MMQTTVGRFITGSPWMRSSYAVLKAFTFGWLLLLSVLDELLIRWPLFPQTWVETGLTFGYWVAIITATMCLVRGLPVIIEGSILIHKKEGEAGTSSIR